MFIRSQMASGWDNHGYFSAAALSSMMSVDPKKENKYNVVITGDCLIGMHNSVGIKFVDWLLSKHVLMSGYDDDVRFAGEIWMEHRNEGLVLHVSNNSGTYLPTDEQLTATGQYVAAALPGLRVELHPNPAKADSLVLDPNRDQDTFFTFKRILLLALGLMLGLGFLLFVPSKVN
ncbi:unnamed protein product [Didymodactylos carnosus]|uniref:Uncharacterized protein n=1 Tax=Didymodactylos carnosus TaxID=1234261 RepID=A0A813V3F1_9BILA|nr:unnamed protein product [Didymodactylos carnosus]CAF1305581.1 unnamed protein product [Didymodactylos carnosus]CAF3624915.1 unnamed protein product [Didymodactylos carnosus]CAF4112617.1 unnamed protein product [Didymodactylos carnosus]